MYSFTMPPVLTIVTLTFNNFDDLVATLDSLKPVLSENSNIESLVINGGTCEKTRAYLESGSNSNIRHISEPDNGIADAFNKGARNALGRYIIFINSGDLLIDADYLHEAISILEKDSHVEFVYSDLTFNDPWLGPVKITAPGDQRSLGHGMPYPHQSLIVKKSLFDRVGYFDTTYKICMDFEWVCRMRKMNFQGKYLARSSVLMDGTGISSRQGVNGLRETVRALKTQGLLTFGSRIVIANRRLRIALRSTLNRLGMEPLVTVLRRLKHG